MNEKFRPTSEIRLEKVSQNMMTMISFALLTRLSCIRSGRDTCESDRRAESRMNMNRFAS